MKPEHAHQWSREQGRRGQQYADALNSRTTRAGGDTSLAGRHFVIVGGSRLAVAVARRFLSRNARLTIVIRDETDEDTIYEAVARGAAATYLEIVASPRNLRSVLEDRAGDAECVLALADESELNVLVAIFADQIHKPVVLRAFDPRLAETVEQKIANVRRAYSMAHLSAPFFVTAALMSSADDRQGETPSGDDHGFGTVLTMRAGVEYVTVCHVGVPSPAPKLGRHRLVGSTPEALASRTGVHVVARRMPEDESWTPTKPAENEPPLREGENIVLGGPSAHVFRLLRDNWSQQPSRRAASRLRAPRPTRRRRVNRDRVSSSLSRVSARWVKTLLATFVLLTIIVAIAPRGDIADRVYTWVSTALGNTQNVSRVSKTTELMLAVGLLAGGIAFGLAIALGATFLIERRMTELMERRVRHLSHHIVVIGLNEVSFRVTEILIDLGIDCAVVDPHPEVEDTAAVRFVSLLNERAPVIRGELGQALARARIERAAGLIGCSEDNLANLEACLRANPPDATRQRVRTVARIWDEEDVLHYLGDWGVDQNLAAVDAAADAFVEGALFSNVVRPFRIGAQEPLCMAGVRRLPSGRCDISEDEWRELSSHGVHAVAYVDSEADVSPAPYLAERIAPADEVILIGPWEAMEGLVHQMERPVVEEVSARAL